MKVELNISRRDQANFAKQVGELTKKLNLRKEDVLQNIAEKTRGEAMKLLDSQRSTNTGQLKNSITIRKNQKGRRRVGTNTGYGLYVEYGRPAGKRPPKDVILRWVNRKLGLKGKVAEGVAFVVAKAIGQRGTAARPFLRPALERAKTKLLYEMKKQLVK